MLLWPRWIKLMVMIDPVRPAELSHGLHDELEVLATPLPQLPGGNYIGSFSAMVEDVLMSLTGQAIADVFETAARAGIDLSVSPDGDSPADGPYGC
jgi:hypothetical protein